jgi:hypothetical protein
MEDKGSGAGIGFAGILFIVFLVLKLCNVIQWSWWWVTSPLWITAILIVIVILIASIMCVAENKRRK